MSAKITAADTVQERRLRPIYDQLDYGNNKKALQEADKVLKKQPDFQCCRVLKCLALIRLGREEEAEVLLDKVLEECPVDEGALQAMTIGYRELQQPQKICKMYEGASKKDPKNEEFLTHLFMSYVRLGDFKKQQIVSMNLYKVKQKNPYYFWSVMSLVLQAVEGDHILGQTVSLPLAHKMVEKMSQGDKMDQEQEILLYLLVLELRKDWKAGLEVLDNKLGQKLANSASYRNFCSTKRLEFNLNSCNWSEVAKLASQELEDQPDQWSAYTNYLSAIKHLIEDENIDTNIDMARDLVRKHQDNNTELRGPWLAEFELVSSLINESHLLPNLFLNYFDKFGDKAVTFSDLKKYLHLLSLPLCSELVKSLKDRWDTSPDSLSSIKEVIRDINLRAIIRYVGSQEDSEISHKDQTVDDLVTRYKVTQHLVKGMLDTDLRPPDNYLLMASHFLWDLWHLTRDSKYFLKAVSLLELGLSASSINWQLKLMMIKFLGLVGCGDISYSFHSSMDIKHLMLDSLGWVVSRQLWGSGQFLLSSQHIAACNKLYNHVNKDTADHIITAYRSGTFYQIKDIYNLRSRVTRSLGCLSGRTEKQLLDLHTLQPATYSQVVQMLSYPELDCEYSPTVWTQVQDNRDLETMTCWDRYDINQDRADSLNQETKVAECRHLMFCCMTTSIYLTEDIVPDYWTSSEKPQDRLTSLLERLASHCKQSRDNSKSSHRSSRPQAPDTDRLSAYVASNQVDTLLPLLTSVLTLSKRTPDSDLDPSLEASLDTVVTHLMSSLSQLEQKIAVDGSNLMARFQIMEQAVLLSETLGLLGVVSGAIQVLLRPAGKGGKKVKKGKCVVPVHLQFLVKPFNRMIKLAGEVATKLVEGLEKFEVKIKESGLEYSFSGLSLDEDVQKDSQNIFQKMSQSYRDSFHQVKTIVRSKKTYIESLNL